MVLSFHVRVAEVGTGWAASTNGQGRPGPFEGGRWQGSGWCDNVGHLVEVLVEGLVGKVDV